jgi:4-diphosphocytidyl-2-C-methyl-D-erythritol kinase
MPPSTWRDLVKNDFEKSIIKKFPEIGKIKNTLYETGAIYSSMSGSGSTVYGIYPGEPVIADELKKYVIFNGKL